MGLDLFQFLCFKISSDSIVDQEDHFSLLMNGLFQYFNLKNQWRDYKFAEFIFVLMVFNTTKAKIEGQFDYLDFYEILKNYNETKQKELVSAALMKNSMMGTKLDFQAQNTLLDLTMLDRLIENLFRVLMSDLPVFQRQENDSIEHNPYKDCSPGYLQSKQNLIAVLYEMILMVDQTVLDIEGNDNLNSYINGKFVADSSLYIQIFIDLAKFGAV